MTIEPFIASAPVRLPTAARGPYGWLTPYLGAIARHNPDIAARLLTLDRQELHFIALAVALMGPAADDADHLAAMARGIGVVTRKTLIANAADLGGYAPRGLHKLANTLAGGLWRAPTYRRLAALSEEPNARKVLRHSASVTRRQVLLLSRLPPAYRTGGVLKMIRRPRDRVEVLFGLELVRRIRTDLDDRRILASLEKADATYIREWVLKHLERAPFPPAPVPALNIDGVEAMRPLACFDDLARSAREFKNCIRDYLWRVLRGEAYFYRYAPSPGGRGVAIVELRRVPIAGWVVHEALGPDNNTLSGATRAAILSAFASAGVPAAPQASSRDGWFDLD